MPASSTNSARRVHVRAIVAAIGLTVSAAQAQYALGDGRQLDGSLNIRGRLNNATTNFSEEVQFRNAIVTGNAPGGFSFRGDVGYAAPNAFRGSLGSNDTFAFRRDSLVSGLAGMGIRGTDALQYQMSMTTGGRPPARLVGGFVVNEAGSGATAGQVTTRTPSLPQYGDPNLGSPDTQRRISTQLESPEDVVDDRGSMLYTLRSPSAYLTTRDYQPTLLNVYGSEQNQNAIAMVASPLRGVRMEPMGVRTEEAVAAKPNPDIPTSQNQFATPSTRIDRSIPSTRSTTAYDEMIAGVREQLGLAGAETAEAARDPQWLSRIREIQLEILDAQQQQGPAAEPDADDTPGFDPSTVNAIREGGATVSSYARPDPGQRDFFTEHLRAGQRLLNAGRYFDAEERFAHALGVRPGDVTAQIGRMHAQLSAGMFLSAAVNLRQVFFDHPEVIGAKYAPEMLPKQGRLDQLKIMLNRSTGLDGQGTGAITPLRQDCILLAYVGWQTGDLALVRRALDAYDVAVTGEDGTVPADIRPEARMVDLLRAVWLGGGSPVTGGNTGQPRDGETTEPAGDGGG